jgi:SAM-dependent methyltransferase
MSFDVAADAYDRYMGRYSRLLSPQLADLAGVRSGQRVGASHVAAVDPSESFVGAARDRIPGVDVRRASAEELPFPARDFDATLAQLVVHFMADPVGGLAEMARVTQQDGVVAACVWDHAGDQGPLSLFWGEARRLDPAVDDESRLPGVREGHLAQMFETAGLREVEASVLWVSLEHATFDAWWEPFTKGVGPAGSYLAGIGADRQVELREACRARIPTTPFVVTARAWAARGLA